MYVCLFQIKVIIFRYFNIEIFSFHVQNNKSIDIFIKFQASSLKSIFYNGLKKPSMSI